MAWRETISGMSMGQIIKAAYRKFIFRRAEMGLYEVMAGSVQLPIPEDFDFRYLAADEVDFEALANPNLNDEDVKYLRSHPDATCVVAMHGDQVAGSLWALRGRALVTELGSTLDLGVDGHYLCRAHVRAHGRCEQCRTRDRSRALNSKMIDYYILQQAPTARICGLIYDWNKRAIKNFMVSGGQRTGTHWSVWLLGLHFTGVRRLDLEQGATST